jgi:hypothetical protein
MHFQVSVGLACLLHFFGTSLGLPSDQQPLNTHNSKDVQAVRAQ